jgi:hypothetical protein
MPRLQSFCCLDSVGKTLIALTPLTLLVVLPGSFVYPFVAPKVFLFRTLVTVLAGLWLLLLLGQRERFGPRATPITILLGLFLASAAISTVLGVDPYRSFWGTEERQLGLFTLLHYGVFYLVAASVIDDWRSWRAIFAALVPSASSRLSGIRRTSEGSERSPSCCPSFSPCGKGPRGSAPAPPRPASWGSAAWS